MELLCLRLLFLQPFHLCVPPTKGPRLSLCPWVRLKGQMLKHGVSFPLGQPEIRLPSCKSEGGGWVMQPPPPSTFHQQILTVQNCAGCQGTWEEESQCLCQGLTSSVGTWALAPATESSVIVGDPWVTLGMGAFPLLCTPPCTLNCRRLSLQSHPRALKSSTTKNSNPSCVLSCQM